MRSRQIEHSQRTGAQGLDFSERFLLRTVAHASFKGFNRSQASVIEAAILVSRLRMLPRDKVEREMTYLQAAVKKTASPVEEEAWRWLEQAVVEFYNSPSSEPSSAGR